LTRGLPRDQALGLRLMAMARAAAGMHMGRTALGDFAHESAQTDHTAQEGAANPQLLRSQASGLFFLRNPKLETRNPEFPS